MNPVKIFAMLYKVFNKFAKNSLWTLISLLMFIIFVVISLYAYAELNLPNVAALRDVHLQVPLRIYSSDGQLMGEFGTKRRIPVTLDQVPKQLIQAVLATEDSRFYEHPGVDFIGLIRAAKAVILSGQKVQGASTITMQVARNFFLTPKKTYKRKFNEILLALKIDREFGKDKILELYLNKIYLGQRAYGVAAAAQVYYGKTLDQLTLPEMAMIAGLPQAPSTDNPITSPARAVDRRNHVLERMRDLNDIDEKTYEEAIKAPVTASYHDQPIQLHADYVAEMVRDALVKQFGDEVYEKGWNVYTTIHSQLQIEAEKNLDKGLMDYALRHGFRKTNLNYGNFSATIQTVWQKKLAQLPQADGLQPAAVISIQMQSIKVLLANNQIITIPWSGLSWAKPFNPNSKFPGPTPTTAGDIVKVGDVVYVMQQNKQWILSELPQVQGALVSFNPKNGALLALTGGFDFSVSNFNRAIQAKRQPGSSFKPFVYSAALNKGYTLATVINDAPIVLKDTGENQWWRPENDTDQFYGPTRLRIALIQSRNLVSIRLLQMIGIDYAIDYLQRFGFDVGDLPHSLSLALGSATETPYQMASAYMVFANGGYRVLPFFVQKIVDQQNNIVYQADSVQACEDCLTPAPRVITAQNAYLINNAL
ncbi:MAG: peptidase, partial [Gammaproteobacteria bacterium RIFOXYB2_FULL_38_6]